MSYQISVGKNALSIYKDNELFTRSERPRVEVLVRVLLHVLDTNELISHTCLGWKVSRIHVGYPDLIIICNEYLKSISLQLLEADAQELTLELLKALLTDTTF